MLIQTGPGSDQLWTNLAAGKGAASARAERARGDRGGRTRDQALEAEAVSEA